MQEFPNWSIEHRLVSIRSRVRLVWAGNTIRLIHIRTLRSGSLRRLIHRHSKYWRNICSGNNYGWACGRRWNNIVLMLSMPVQAIYRNSNPYVRVRCRTCCVTDCYLLWLRLVWITAVRFIRLATVSRINWLIGIRLSWLVSIRLNWFVGPWLIVVCVRGRITLPIIALCEDIACYCEQ